MTTSYILRIYIIITHCDLIIIVNSSHSSDMLNLFGALLISHFLYFPMELIKIDFFVGKKKVLLHVWKSVCMDIEFCL